MEHYSHLEDIYFMHFASQISSTTIRMDRPRAVRRFESESINKHFVYNFPTLLLFSGRGFILPL